MGFKNEKTDEYIAKAAPFAQPILHQLRQWVHDTAPDSLQETIKWGMPCFEHKGMLANMAAFKGHCSFGFWKGKLLKDTHGILKQVGDTGMGQFGKVHSLDDLPSEAIFKEYLLEAIALNENNISIIPKTAVDKHIVTPVYLETAIANSAKAKAVFDNFSASNRKEYIEWLEDAKTENTRMKRLATALEWIAEGKPRNWKYMKQWKNTK